MWGPDEQVYRAQALTVRDRGPVQGLRTAADRFLSEGAEHFPSPLRWLWIWLSAALSGFGWRAASLASLALLPLAAWWASGSIWAAGIVASSPLAWVLGRRALQDTTVALAVVVAFGCATHGHTVGLGAAVFALLGLKEAGILYLPALAAAGLLSGSPVLATLGAIATATGAWWLATWAILGRSFGAILDAIRGAHDSGYSKQFQRGGPHRLLVDIALCSPLLLIAALVDYPIAAFVVTALLLHGLSPVNNVRTVLGVEIVLRLALVPFVAARSEFLALILIVDLLVLRKLRDVYDPTTAALTKALGMQ